MAVVVGEADNRLIGGVLGMVQTDALAGGNGASAGVVGLAGTSAATDDWNGNVESFGQPVLAAVLGAVPAVSQDGRPASTSLGFLAGTEPLFGQQTGVYGQSAQQGLVGVSGGAVGAGVFGAASQSGGDLDPAKGGTGVRGTGYIGVHGETVTGVGVQGKTFGAGLAGLFNGNVRVEGGLEVTGVITVDGDISLRNRDVAERFDAVAECVPGSVMVIEDNAKVQPCARPYDKRAVGVVSGAGYLKPAIILGEDESPATTVPIAMLGTALCLVDADKAAIEVGDLLTSSDTPGHAMKAVDQTRSFGAVIGKALGPLAGGRGMIPIVVALQ